MKCPLS